MKTLSNGSKSIGSSELFYENEVKTNRLAAVALLIYGIQVMIMVVLDKFGVYELGNRLSGNFMLLSGTVDIAVFLSRRRGRIGRPF